MRETDTQKYTEVHWKSPGIIVIDKPQGPSSHQVAAWVGELLHCKVGHAGTLDPQVSGLLLVMLGSAVRLAPLLLSHKKEYVCAMKLHGDCSRSKIDEVISNFTGRIYQRPPRKSAVKRNLRIRMIYDLTILEREERLILFRVTCEAGTYIRSLCHHIGLALGTGAHMQELRRTRSGAFGEQEMHTLHDVRDACWAAERGKREELESMILSVDAAVPNIPRVVINDRAIDAICRGASLAGLGIMTRDDFKKGQTVAIISQKQEFICLGVALVPSTSVRPGEPGLVISPTTVFMPPGTYPQGWKKRGVKR